MNRISWSRRVTASWTRAWRSRRRRTRAEALLQRDARLPLAQAQNQAARMKGRGAPPCAGITVPPTGLQFPALPLEAAAKLSGPGFQPGRFPSRDSAWLPPGPRVWQPTCVRFPDSSRRLWSPSLPQATPADMFAKAFRVKSNTAIKGSDR